MGIESLTSHFYHHTLVLLRQDWPRLCKIIKFKYFIFVLVNKKVIEVINKYLGKRSLLSAFTEILKFNLKVNSMKHYEHLCI